MSELTVFTPQGTCSVIMPQNKALGITGLYTDNFSTCNILICISPTQVKLMHIDAQMARQHYYQHEIDNMQDLTKIIHIRRSSLGDAVRSLMNHIDDVEEITITPEVLAVYVDSLGNYQLLRAAEIENLKSEKPFIHHPAQQCLETIRKITQIVGLREEARSNGKAHKKKAFRIFCNGWEPLSDNDLQLKSDDKVTKEEISLFNKDMSMFVNMVSYHRLFQEINQEMAIRGNSSEFLMDIVMYLEAYFNDFDHYVIFCRNVKALPLTIGVHKTEADAKFIAALSACFSAGEEPTVIKKIDDLVTTFTAQSEQTDFKRMFVNAYQDFRRHYNKGKQYDTIAANCKAQIKEYKAAYPRAIQLISQDVNAAANLLYQALQCAMSTVVKSNPNLANILFAYGRAMYNTENYSAAYEAFAQCSELRNHYIENSSEANKQAAHKWLTICEGKLSPESRQQVNTISTAKHQHAL